MNYEQRFWHAIREYEWLHWSNLPINGFVRDEKFNTSVKVNLQKFYHPIFSTAKNLFEIPQIEINSLL